MSEKPKRNIALGIVLILAGVAVAVGAVIAVMMQL